MSNVINVPNTLKTVQNLTEHLNSTRKRYPDNMEKIAEASYWLGKLHFIKMILIKESDVLGNVKFVQEHITSNLNYISTNLKNFI